MTANNYYSLPLVEKMPFDEFEDILKNTHNFIDFRYLSAGNGLVQSHSGLLSSLNEAVRNVLLNIEQSNLSK